VVVRLAEEKVDRGSVDPFFAVGGVRELGHFGDELLCHIWTQPRAKGDSRVEGESGRSHIFGLFKELHSMLLALMEIRAPSPGQPNGLEGPGTGQV
jgi:hypothetical protein